MSLTCCWFLIGPITLLSRLKTDTEWNQIISSVHSGTSEHRERRTKALLPRCVPFAHHSQGLEPILLSEDIYFWPIDAKLEN